jgi:hypothetical protein
MGIFNRFTRRQNKNNRRPNNNSKKGFFKSIKNRFTKTPTIPKTTALKDETLQLFKDLKSLTPEQKAGFLNLGKQLDTNPSELVIPRYLVKPVLISIKILIMMRELALKLNTTFSKYFAFIIKNDKRDIRSLLDDGKKQLLILKEAKAKATYNVQQRYNLRKRSTMTNVIAQTITPQSYEELDLQLSNMKMPIGLQKAKELVNSGKMYYKNLEREKEIERLAKQYADKLTDDLRNIKQEEIDELKKFYNELEAKYYSSQTGGASPNTNKQEIRISVSYVLNGVLKLAFLLTRIAIVTFLSLLAIAFTIMLLFFGESDGSGLSGLEALWMWALFQSSLELPESESEENNTSKKTVVQNQNQKNMQMNTSRNNRSNIGDPEVNVEITRVSNNTRKNNTRRNRIMGMLNPMNPAE